MALALLLSRMVLVLGLALPLAADARLPQGRNPASAATGRGVSFTAVTGGYLAQCQGFSAQVQRDGMRLSFPRAIRPSPAPTSPLAPWELPAQQGPKLADIDLRFSGARPGTLKGEAPHPGRTHLYLGSDPAAWRTGAESFGQLRAPGLYPGVDLVLRGSAAGLLEFDLELEAGRGTGELRLTCGANARFSLDADGTLQIHQGRDHAVSLPPPVIFQPTPEGRRAANGGYRLLGSREVGFHLEGHDPAGPVVIDPLIVSASVFGGTGNNRIVDLKMTPAGDVLMLILTNAPDFPTKTPYQAASGGGYDGVLLKMDKDQALLWSTYFGGSGNEQPSRMALAPDGSVYVVGATASTNFPLLNPIQASYGGGMRDGFLMHFSAAGGLLSSTYLGGGGDDVLTCCGLDSAGNLYVGGWSDSSGSKPFPTLNAFQSTNAGGLDGVLLCTNPAVSSLVFSTYVGGTSADYIFSLAAIPAGGCFFGGQSFSANFPLASPYQSSRKGTSDGVLGRLSAAGSLLKSGYFGGAGDQDSVAALALDPLGNLWTGASFTSTDMPVLNPFQAAHAGGGQDIHLSLWDPNLAAPLFASYYGGNGNDSVAALATTPQGNLWLAGYTESSNLNLPGADQTYNGGGDGLALRLDPPAGVYPGTTGPFAGVLPLGDFTQGCTLGYGTCDGNAGLDWNTSVATNGKRAATGGSGWHQQKNPITWAGPGPAENDMYAWYAWCIPPVCLGIGVSGGNPDFSVDSGTYFALVAHADGTGPFTYKWTTCAYPIIPFGTGEVSESMPATLQDDGMEFCLDIKNECGTASCKIKLKVNNKVQVTCNGGALGQVGLFTNKNQSSGVVDLRGRATVTGSFLLQKEFEMVFDGGTGSTLSSDGFFHPGPTAGTVQIRVKALDDPSKSCTFSINLHDWPASDAEEGGKWLKLGGLFGAPPEVVLGSGGDCDTNGDAKIDQADIDNALSRSSFNRGR